MKRLIGLCVLGLALFYIAWPAYSGYAIRAALDAKDPGALRERIDFESVRTSMRPAITAKVESTLDAAATKAGPNGANIYAALKTQIMPKIVEAALSRVVTPEALIRVHAERGTIKDILDRQIGDQVAKAGGLGGLAGALSGETAGQGGSTNPTGCDAGKLLGGLLGKKETAVPAPKPAATAGEVKPSLSWRNIKGFGFEGPTGVYLSLAKDAASPEPDLTAHMTFQGGGWMLTGLEPRL